MAQPIGATPVLRGREAAKFLTMVLKDEENPVGLVPTPKLEKARQLVKKHSNKHAQKQVR